VTFAAVGLFRQRQLRELYDADRVEFGLAIATFAGVVAFGMLTGILVAVGLSLAVFLGGVVRPHDAVLGSVDGVDGFHSVAEEHDLEAAPGVIVYRFDGPLFFANADYFLTRALSLLAGRQLKCFVLDLEAVTSIDVTAGRAIEKLRETVVASGASFHVARTTVPTQRHLRALGLAEAIGEANFHPTVRAALETCRAQ
jgi:SulP family sulfate permease